MSSFEPHPETVNAGEGPEFLVRILFTQATLLPDRFFLIIWVSYSSERLENRMTTPADRHHEQVLNRSNQLLGAAIENANASIKIILTINGGAAVVILAFTGQILISKAGEKIDIPNIADSLICFAIGVSLSALAMIAGYVANRFYSLSSDNMTRISEYPYLEKNFQSEKFDNIAIIANLIGFLSVILGVVFFVLGVFVVRTAIQSTVL